jgi:hypothetical protein
MANGGGSSGFATGLWVADIEKMLQGEYWTNRYIIEAGTMGAAETIAGTIMGLEKSIHNTGVLFTRYRVSDGQPNTDVYQVTQANVFGENNGDGTSLLPLFNVLRADFTTAGGGRPSRKYLRGIIAESHVSFNSLNADFRANIAASYVNPLVNLVGYVDVDGQQIVSGSLYPFVGMRQLRRASKRKTTTAGTTV